MAGYELDDLDFDEQGIYREKESHGISDQDILVDEDGIWRDDTDHWSHYTFHTDSGIGRDDRKSSSSTLNRLQENDYDFGNRLSPHILEPEYREGSLHTDEKSLNISELEASESVAGEISFDQQSFHSEDNLYLPELQDESYIITSGTTSRRSSRSCSSHPSIEGTGEDFRRDDHLFGDHLSTESDHILHQSAHPLSYLLDVNGINVDDYVKQASEAQYPDSDATRNLRHQQKRHPPRVVGDSLFTQEDRDIVVRPAAHSLLEFEQLEAALNVHDTSGDNTDLIGAYLQGLQEQDELDEDEELSFHNDNDPTSFHDDLYTQETVLPQHTKWATSSNQGLDELLLQPTVASENSRGETLADVTSSFAFEDSHSFITSQQPPFTDSLIESSLGDCLGDTRGSISGPNTRNHQLPGTTRIPMLRSRSPSMSRPGSSRGTSPDHGHAPSPQYSRPQSPLLHPQLPLVSPAKRKISGSGGSMSDSAGSSHSRPQERGRSLPPTPLKPQHNLSFSGSAASASPRTSPSPTPDYHGNATRQALDTATSLLLGEGEKRLKKFDNGMLHFEDTGSVGDAQSHHGDYLGPLSEGAGNMHEHQVPGSSGSLFKHRNALPSTSPRRPSSRRVTPEAMDTRASTSCDESEDLSQGSEPPQRLKSRFLKEVKQRKQNEQTLHHLQSEYNTLLKRFAEAENTIDEMRTGAIITLQTDVASPGHATGGAVPNAQLPTAVNIGNRGNGSLNNIAQLGSQQGSRPNSRPGSRTGSISSLPSNWVGPSASIAGSQGGRRISGLTAAEEIRGVEEDSVKMALAAKAYAVEEQANNFQTLTAEGHLNPEDQIQALANIKGSLEGLRQEYRDARSLHDLRRRQGHAVTEVVFDENKDVEGELYRLGMKLDDLEHNAQENQKSQKKSGRKPPPHTPTGPSPLKADHGLPIGNVNTKLPLVPGGLPQSDTDGTNPLNLSPRRPPSVGSIAGSPGDIDATLHTLHKDYNSLMDRYRRLKQMRHCPDRDQEVQKLLENLKDVYVNTPDHRKPALPPELENLYDVNKNAFVAPEELDDENDLALLHSPQMSPRQEPLESNQSENTRHGRARRESDKYRDINKNQERDQDRGRDRGRQKLHAERGLHGSTTQGSDTSSPGRGPQIGRSRQVDRSPGSDYASSSTAMAPSTPGSTHSQRRRPQIPDKYSSTANSQRNFRKGDAPSRRNNAGRDSSKDTKMATSSQGRRGDGDSGYHGSESSKRNMTSSAAGGSAQKLGSRKQLPRGPVRTSALDSLRRHENSDSDSASTASTVEERSQANSRSGSEGSRRHSSRKLESPLGGGRSRGHAVDGQSRGSNSHSRGRDGTNHGTTQSESEEVSRLATGRHGKREPVKASHETGGTKNQTSNGKAASPLSQGPGQQPRLILQPQPLQLLQGQVLQGSVLPGSVIQPLPGQLVQGQPLQGQSLQVQSLQGQPLQGQSLQGQPLQGQALQGHPVHGHLVQVPHQQGHPIQNNLLQSNNLLGQSVQDHGLAGQSIPGQPMLTRSIPGHPQAYNSGAAARITAPPGQTLLGGQQYNTNHRYKNPQDSAFDEYSPRSEDQDYRLQHSQGPQRLQRSRSFSDRDTMEYHPNYRRDGYPDADQDYDQPSDRDKQSRSYNKYRNHRYNDDYVDDVNADGDYNRRRSLYDGNDPTSYRRKSNNPSNHEYDYHNAAYDSPYRENGVHNQDYGDQGGYYSDQESPGDRSDRREYWRRYYARNKQDSSDRSSRGKNTRRVGYTDQDVYHPPDHRPGPLDEKYLTPQTGHMGANDAMATASAAAPNGVMAGGGAVGGVSSGAYGGTGFAAAPTQPNGYTAMGTHNQAIQNVPQMSTMGVQYAPQAGAAAVPSAAGYVPSSGYSTGYALNGSQGNVLGSYATGVINSGNESQRQAQRGLGSDISAFQPVSGVGVASGVVAACPLCGGQSYHAHGDYVYQPQPTSGTSSVYYMPATSDTTTNTAVNGVTSYIPVQLVNGATNNGSAPSKVRYYVREYGGSVSCSEEEQIQPNKSRSGRRNHDDHLPSDGENDEDLNTSLKDAMDTAKLLKKMSRKMKGSLSNELERTHRESSHLRRY